MQKHIINMHTVSSMYLFYRHKQIKTTKGSTKWMETHLIYNSNGSCIKVPADIFEESVYTTNSGKV